MDTTDISLLIDTCEKSQKVVTFLLDAIHEIPLKDLPKNALMNLVRAENVILTINTSKWR